MQLLRILLIIIIVYYFLKLLVRYVFPILLNYTIRRTQENIQREHRPPQRKNGEIIVEYSPEKKPHIGDVGEYVDYEEIKD